MECGPRRQVFSDDVIVGDAGCANVLRWCPLAPGDPIDPTHQIVVYTVYSTRTTAYLRTEVACDVGLGPAFPTMAAIRAEVTRRGPPPMTTAGGTDYLLNAAVVFSATTARGTTLTDVTIPDFPLAGHHLTAALHLTKTVWTWGDGTTTTLTRGDLTGHPYTDADPCQTPHTCDQYIAHDYTSTGTSTTSVEAFWDATVTADGATTNIPVTGGIHRPDPAGATITIHQARSVLVGH